MSGEKEAAVVVRTLSKSFQLPHEKHNGLKQAALSIFNTTRGYERQVVLNDVSFEVRRGEFLGIVGRNGSGKSTLLKLLAGIYSPDKGHIQVNGSLTPFIELGVGFNPELTARENVFLNCALLGMSTREVNEIYDEIVDFSELERFMDQRLKNFSSGMQVRLAFAIAIKSKSEILLFDEVLAVGDTRFQKKCYKYFYEIKNDPTRTVILVTHDMAAVHNFCDRAIVIDRGSIVYDGDPDEASVLYQEINFPKASGTTAADGIKISVESDKMVYRSGETVRLKIEWDKKKHNDIRNAGVALMSSDGGYVFGTNTIIDRHQLNEGDSKIDYRLKLDVGAGSYILRTGLFGATDADVKFFDERGIAVEVASSESFGGVTKLEHSWR